MTKIVQHVIALLLILAIAACRQQGHTVDDIQLEMTASDTLVGETTLRVTVSDSAGNAIANPGELRVRGDMNHAGMVPVFAESDAANNGVFNLPFEWTMAGGWTAEASLKLPNGDVARETFAFEIMPAAGEITTDMHHSGMDHESELAGESSAVYMRISNRGDTDQVIVAAESAIAQHIEFHQTIVEDDIARMEALNALFIPAGETLELRPGGAHIMLNGLNADLRPESQFTLQLKCSTGEAYALPISIADMQMSDLDDAVSYGDLVFSNRWARPAQAGVAHADMPMNSEAPDA